MASICASGVDLGIVGNVAGQDDIGVEIGGQLADTLLEFIDLVGEGEFGAFAFHGFCNAVSDGAVAEQTDDEGAFAVEKSHLFLSFSVGSWVQRIAQALSQQIIT
jgi:hypothetical protein